MAIIYQKVRVMEEHIVLNHISRRMVLLCSDIDRLIRDLGFIARITFVTNIIT